MSRSSNDSSWGKRRSLFALPSLSASNSQDDVSKKPGKLKRNSHRRGPSLLTDLNHPDIASETDVLRSAPALSDSKAQRPPLNIRGGGKRPSGSGFEVIRSPLRSGSEDSRNDVFGAPLSSTPSSSTSLGLGDGSMEAKASARIVLLHGEVQTSAGMFRKKKEYLVLTETHMIRFKSQARAAEMFRVISGPGTRPYGGGKHGSFGSQSEIQTLSDSSGDKEGRVPLRQVVAVYRTDDGKPTFALDVCYLDEESTQSSSLLLQFSNPEERDIWLKNIRGASNDARLREQNYISSFNIENAARIVERANDYDPSNCAIYKIVQRQASFKSNRSSTDDFLKLSTTVCFLAIGVHKVHIIQLVKPANRSSSPSIGQTNAQVSHGILTMTSLKVSDFDDALVLTFRQPLQPARHLLLASSASYEIAARLHAAENFLRPDCGQRLYKLSIPAAAENLLAPLVVADEEHSCLDRTLAAYCVAYGLNPANVRYTINYNCEDGPRFELLPPADTRRPDYGPLALLAVMRALRYNESFGSISFANIDLDSLNGLHDNHGQEMVCMRTKRGTPIKLTIEELGRACLLVQEVRALAAASKKLRRMDFSGCVTPKDAVPTEAIDDDAPKTKDIGCGVVEALVPLCRHQTTNVDWIALNGTHLSDTDLDYLVSAAVDKSCHFRAIELNRCGLNDRSMGLILDALRAHDNTLEAVEIAGNTARLDPSTFDSQLSMFGFIRKLNLSYVSRTSGSEPLITAETLLIWRLQELRLSGTGLNSATIDAVATYLAHPQSMALHEMYVDNAYLSGRDIATLLHSLSHDPDHPRDLHLDISQNYLTRGLESVTKAIADGFTPSHLSMRSIEYREESLFRKMLVALTANKTIRFLDMSQTALQGDAGEETCRALYRLLAENQTLQHLDISGEDSRLATFKFGTGINDALAGLKLNKSIQSLRVEKQKLGLQGASTLAEVLKENSTLRELHCGNNEIPLHGLTDLVNSLIENTTLVYLPTMDDGREAALKSAELTMKGLPDVKDGAAQESRTASMGSPAGVRRGLNSVRKSAVRAASAYAPAFPAFAPTTRATPSPELKASSPLSLNLQPPKTRRNSQSPVAASVLFTVQDIQTTHRLLSEQWDRQCYRLAQYLERNWNLMNGIPVDLEVEDEKFERPESVGSMGKMLEQVKSDTTPRKEKDTYFEMEMVPDHPPVAAPTAAPYTSMTADEKHGLSFTQFYVPSGVSTPDSMEDLDHMTKQMHMNASMENLEEPKTPTQKMFPR